MFLIYHVVLFWGLFYVYYRYLYPDRPGDYPSQLFRAQVTSLVLPIMLFFLSLLFQGLLPYCVHFLIAPMSLLTYVLLLMSWAGFRKHQHDLWLFSLRTLTAMVPLMWFYAWFVSQLICHARA